MNSSDSKLPIPLGCVDKRSGSLTMRSMLSVHEMSQNVMATSDESDNKSWDERWKMFYGGKILHGGAAMQMYN